MDSPPTAVSTMRKMMSTVSHTLPTKVERSDAETTALRSNRAYGHDAAAAAAAVLNYTCYSLPHRTLLKLEGRDTNSFLQGIITNDTGLLEEPGQRAVYAHMLNVQGRTLYDIILYSLKDATGSSLLLECDSTVKDKLLRHLTVYKIRRKVEISTCGDLSPWAVLPKRKNSEVPVISSPKKAPVCVTDPRTEAMGWRLMLDSQVDPLAVIASCQRGDTEEYHRHRYSIGLPEGVKDLPPEVALPLESNLVYMEGISFSKGCYIGQELTARTHHTGVVRKRLMPVSLSSALTQGVAEGTSLHTQSGKAAGKHRTGVGELGLSLIRLAHAKEVLLLTSSDGVTVNLEASVPEWWPKDLKLK
ncbi:hypothetical protein CRUP_008907 [Coryphaenoides rupestris]|nr:hypothetical protein CRUP_008907 [Coryphaenoides rupestris]